MHDRGGVWGWGMYVAGGIHGGGMCGRGMHSKVLAWHRFSWQGGVHDRGACMVGDMCGGCVHGRGPFVVGGACVAGGHTWRGGTCVAGETATAADGTHPAGMHSCYRSDTDMLAVPGGSNPSYRLRSCCKTLGSRRTCCR